MKLSEIIQQVDKTHRYYGPFNDTRGLMNRISTKSPAGFYSKVTPNKKDPHMVDKSTFISTADDGSDAYLGYIAGIKGDLNPFFPRVYKVTRVKDTRGNIRPKYILEKLVPLSALSDDEADALCRYVHPQLMDDIERMRAHSVHPDKNDYNAPVVIDLLIEAIISMFDNPSEFGVLSNTKPIHSSNKLLQKAIHKIIDIIDNGPTNYMGLSKFRLDIKDDNFMVRRTPHGPQLVITDPLAN